ncbi:MAG: DUF1648 domain-containing protein [Acidobacteria bacterium]|nr:DUF1648 domain-containing protein [Acidobacteriota bacterium]
MRPVWHALAAVMTVGPVLWLIAVYPDLPARVPVHWNIHGDPDRWAAKSLASVFLVGIISIWVQLLMGLLIHDSDTARERASSASLRHSLDTMYQLLQPMRFVLAAMMAVIMMGLKAGKAEPWFSPAMMVCTAALMGGALIGVYRGWKAQNAYEASIPSDAPEFRDENYRLGVIYYNPNDANFLVHKRVGIGFTINAAHRRAWVYLLVMVGLLSTTLGAVFLI